MILAQAIALVGFGVIAGLGANYQSLVSGDLMTRLAEGPAEEDTFETIPVADALERLQEGDAIFIDVRLPSQFEAGHIPGALNLPRRRFDELIGQVSDWLPPGVPIVVYSAAKDFDAARAVANWLADLGIEERFAIHEGFEGWVDLSGPVATGPDVVWGAS